MTFSLVFILLLPDFLDCCSFPPLDLGNDSSAEDLGEALAILVFTSSSTIMSWPFAFLSVYYCLIVFLLFMLHDLLEYIFFNLDNTNSRVASAASFCSMETETREFACEIFALALLLRA